MNLQEYQSKSSRTMNKKLSLEQSISNMLMGIQGESGEVADILKKHLYQGHELNEDHLAEEIGDTMFYIVNLCNLLGLDLSKILETNYNKLLNRYPEGFDTFKSINREI